MTKSAYDKIAAGLSEALAAPDETVKLMIKLIDAGMGVKDRDVGPLLRELLELRALARSAGIKTETSP